LCGKVDAGGFDIYARHGKLDIPFVSPTPQCLQVVTSTASDFTYACMRPAADEISEAFDGDAMATKPCVDDVELLHVSFNIHEGDIVVVEQFRFI
jgi:hypothetical protein